MNKQRLRNFTPEMVNAVQAIHSTRIKLKEAIKEVWLKALRSGDYTQGKGCLRVDDKFCCLGVLGDNLNGYRWKSNNLDRRRYELVVLGDDGVERGFMSELIDHGLHEHVVSPIEDDHLRNKMIVRTQRVLTGLNDGGHTFDQIADVIEAVL